MSRAEVRFRHDLSLSSALAMSGVLGQLGSAGGGFGQKDVQLLMARVEQRNTEVVGEVLEDSIRRAQERRERLEAERELARIEQDRAERRAERERAAQRELLEKERRQERAELDAERRRARRLDLLA